MADSSNRFPVAEANGRPVESTPAEDSSIRSVDEANGDHAQTPGESTPAEASKLKVKLRSFAVRDEWLGAKSIFDRHPDMVRTPLTANGDTVLHIAVSANSINFVQQLVDYMTSEDMEIQNKAGNTAFCVAAISGYATLIQIMMAKNDYLPAISGKDGMLPVHLAASSRHHEIVRLLSSDNLLLEMMYNDIERLFLMTISNDFFDVAIQLFQRYRNLFANARTNKNLTALHILARKPYLFSALDSAGVKLFKEMWITDKMLGLIDTLSSVLFDAIQSGNDGAAEMILDENPELLEREDEAHGRSPLHYAVFYGRKSVLNHILDTLDERNNVLRAVDSKGNNVLHLAASYQSAKALSRLDKMRRGLVWFKEVEKRVPRDLRTMKNSDDQKPEDVFYANHEKIYKEVRETAKGIAGFGSPVAALVAAVVFAAALSSLCCSSQYSQHWFVIFILSNAAALFTSSASIIAFLSIFSLAWSIYNEVTISQTLTKLGVALVLLSVVTMLLSFVAASFLIFGHKFKWAAYVVVSMGVLPIILLLLVLWHKYAGRLH